MLNDKSGVQNAFKLTSICVGFKCKGKAKEGKARQGKAKQARQAPSSIRPSCCASSRAKQGSQDGRMLDGVLAHGKTDTTALLHAAGRQAQHSTARASMKQAARRGTFK